MSPACNPAWSGILTALLTPLIAIIVAYIAYRQWRTAQNRLKLDLFDRRFAIHSAAHDLIATVISYGKIDNKDIFAFLSGIQQARWLLNEGIVKYLEKETLGANDQTTRTNGYVRQPGSRSRIESSPTTGVEGMDCRTAGKFRCSI